jgi:hypothetical protein
MQRDHEPPDCSWFGARLAGCVLAFALAGCGASPSSSPATAIPTASQAPSAIPTSTSGGGPIASTATRDRKWLLASSYTPDKYEVSQIEGKITILVFHSVCTGSADGHCQAIQVFRTGDSSPLWIGHYAGVTSFHASPGGFTVTSVRYASSDPLCCPSLPPETREYKWNGKTFTSFRPGSQVSP